MGTYLALLYLVLMKFNASFNFMLYFILYTQVIDSTNVCLFIYIYMQMKGEPGSEYDHNIITRLYVPIHHAGVILPTALDSLALYTLQC